MKAMLLAAGRGERMRPLTDTLPKPLVPVAGKALIEWQIERLVAAGLREIVVNHAHLGHLIEWHLGDGRRVGASIRYSAEIEALETAGGIAQALPLLGDGPFAVANADIFVDYDYRRLLAAAAALDGRERLAHLVFVPNPEHHPAGDFALVDGRVRAREAGQPVLTFSGIGVYHPALFAGIARGTKQRLAPVIAAAAGEERVTGELFEGVWIDVGTAERLLAAERWAQEARHG